MRSQACSPIKQPSLGPTSVQSINNNSTPTVNSLSPYIRAPWKPVAQFQSNQAQN